MKYYSTNQMVSEVSLEEAVIKGLAPDKGLYMPNKIKKLPAEFFENIDKMSFQEMSFRVAEAFFGEDIPADAEEQLAGVCILTDRFADLLAIQRAYRAGLLAVGQAIAGNAIVKHIGDLRKRCGQRDIQRTADGVFGKSRRIKL